MIININDYNKKQIHSYVDSIPISTVATRMDCPIFDAGLLFTEDEPFCVLQDQEIHLFWQNCERSYISWVGGKIMLYLPVLCTSQPTMS